MQIGAARGLLGRDNQGCEQRLSEAEKLANRVQQELVSLIKELRPSEGEKTVSLADRLREYIADWSRQHSIAAEADIENLPPMPYSVENALFRIAQESLSNVARHSGARQISVRVAGEANNRLSVVFADDGGGFDASVVKNGFGLSNIRERAESLPGGQFEMTSAIGKGTRLSIGCAIETAAKIENVEV
jgi:signal transduction histidine kinase